MTTTPNAQQVDAGALTPPETDAQSVDAPVTPATTPAAPAPFGTAAGVRQSHAPAPAPGPVEPTTAEGIQITGDGEAVFGENHMAERVARMEEAGGRFIRVLDFGYRDYDNSLLLHVTDGQQEMLLTTGVGTAMVLSRSRIKP